MRIDNQAHNLSLIIPYSFAYILDSSGWNVMRILIYILMIHLFIKQTDVDQKFWIPLIFIYLAFPIQMVALLLVAVNLCVLYEKQIVMTMPIFFLDLIGFIYFTIKLFSNINM